MSVSLPDSPLGSPAIERDGLLGVLEISAFRRLWVALSLSSFGDWLGLLALTGLAASLSGGSYAQANVAVAVVFILRLAPAVVLGPVAGAFADRLDRRTTMVVCDLIRFALFVSIPIVGTLTWLFVATFLIECAAMFWVPAKEAAVPNLVPRARLEQANQLSLLATYGSAPVAAAVFALLTVAGGPLSRAGIDAVDLALYVNGTTFLVSALTVAWLRALPGRPKGADSDPGAPRPTLWRTIVDGWTYVGRTPLVRGLVVGMLGAFAAGGAVVGLARTHVTDLGAGDPGYGVLFAAVFLGLATGMGLGPRFLDGFSRRRLFGLGIVAAGASLSLLALVPDMVLATLVTFVLGGFTGISWVTGYTLLGLEVADEVRGRTFAFVQSMTRIVLVAVLAVVPLLAAAFGQHSVDVGAATITYNGSAIVFFGAGLLAAALGVTSYRQMDDRRGTPLVADLLTSIRGDTEDEGPERATGYFVALEGGDGAGKSTQADLLAAWLREQGHEVVLTREPGATPLGTRLREIVLTPGGEASAGLTPRAEALLYAADRAQHVQTVVRPALARGAIVVTDRYVDSSIAYQGAGRALPAGEIARLSAWATQDLVPGLTVLLDVPATVAASRRRGSPDRLEAESLDFHERVRAGFRSLAQARPQRYLVADATRPPAEIHALVTARLADALPPSRAQLLARERRAEEERLRVAAAGREQELARQARVAAARRQIDARHAQEAARRAEEKAREREAARLREEARLAAEARAAAEAEARRVEAEEVRRVSAELRRAREAQEAEARRIAEVERDQVMRVHREERRRQEANTASDTARHAARRSLSIPGVGDAIGTSAAVGGAAGVAAAGDAAASAGSTTAAAAGSTAAGADTARTRPVTPPPWSSPTEGRGGDRVDGPSGENRSWARPSGRDGGADQYDPPTQELSLEDELFSLSGVDDGDDDRDDRDVDTDRIDLDRTGSSAAAAGAPPARALPSWLSPRRRDG